MNNLAPYELVMVSGVSPENNVSYGFFATREQAELVGGFLMDADAQNHPEWSSYTITHHAELEAVVRDADKCWAIHFRGPDDVIAAPSKLAAEIVVRNFNAYWDAHKDERSHEVRVVAEVIEWEFSHIEHAKSVIQSFAEYADLLDTAAMHNSAREGKA